MTDTLCRGRRRQRKPEPRTAMEAFDVAFWKRNALVDTPMVARIRVGFELACDLLERAGQSGFLNRHSTYRGVPVAYDRRLPAFGFSLDECINGAYTP